MKTLLLTLEYPPFKGGVANVYENIVKHWPDKSDIFVLHNNEGKLVKEKWPILKWLPAFCCLRKEIKKNNIKHVLVGHILPLGTVAYYLSKVLKFKYSVILHGMDFAFSQKTNRKKILARKILENAENIICINSYVAELVEKEYENLSDKIKVVNPGIDADSCQIDLRIKENLINKYNLKSKVVLFSISRLVKRKGQDMVIQAMPKVLESNPDLIYFIAGAGLDEDYLKKVKNQLPKEVQDRIIFLGKISDEEKWAWLDVCDMFIMLSRNIDGDFEGFGIVYLEANLAGKPVIAGDSGGVRDAVKNNVNGLLVNPENISELEYAIIKLSKDKCLREKLGDQGGRMVLGKFDWEKQVKNIYDIIFIDHNP